MSTPVWCLLFLGNCLFCRWVVSWGGAQWMEGWRSVLLLDWLSAWIWSAEQIRLYVLLCWFAHLIWFVLGLFQPALRV